jgi:hypothetical protein
MNADLLHHAAEKVLHRGRSYPLPALSRLLYCGTTKPFAWFESACAPYFLPIPMLIGLVSLARALPSARSRTIFSRAC